MEKRRELARALRVAHRALKDVIGRLDTSNEPCKGCGRPHYLSWDEYQASVELLAAARKIERWANALEE